MSERPWKLCSDLLYGAPFEKSYRWRWIRDRHARWIIRTFRYRPAGLKVCVLIRNPGEAWRPYQVSIKDTGKP